MMSDTSLNASYTASPCGEQLSIFEMTKASLSLANRRIFGDVWWKGPFRPALPAFRVERRWAPAAAAWLHTIREWIKSCCSPEPFILGIRFLCPGFSPVVKSLREDVKQLSWRNILPFSMKGALFPPQRWGEAERSAVGVPVSWQSFFICVIVRQILKTYLHSSSR